MAQLDLPGMGPPPPVTKTIKTTLGGTTSEMTIEFTVQARPPRGKRKRWRNEVIEIQRKD